MKKITDFILGLFGYAKYFGHIKTIKEWDTIFFDD